MHYSESFISAARLFVAVNVPLLDGLRNFGFRKPDYDTNLGNIAPCALIEGDCIQSYAKAGAKQSTTCGSPSRQLLA